MKKTMVIGNREKMDRDGSVLEFGTEPFFSYIIYHISCFIIYHIYHVLHMMYHISYIIYIYI